MRPRRRTFLKAVAALPVAAVLAAPAVAEAAVAAAVPAPPAHFGQLFPQLPEYSVSDAALTALAETMRDRAPGAATGDNLFYDANGVRTDAIPAGMTYLGQFLDHDITLDRTLLTDANSTGMQATRVSRDPALNLDSVYSGAPRDGDKLLLQTNQFGVLDIPRDERGFAIIGDFRNDENLVLLPVHLGIMRFHNALLNRGIASTFERAQQLTRWYYQWVIATEFLPTILGQPLTDSIISFTTGRPVVKTQFYNPGMARTMVPVEFSVGCYRLHTLIRNNYTIRAGTRIGIFNTQPLNLVGGRPVPPELVQQSNLFFRDATSPAFDPPNTQAGAQSFNVARRIDASISPQLYNLPAFALPNSPQFNNLPLRNMIRGSRIGLAAGQDVARAMGEPVLSTADLNANAANGAGGTHGLTDPAFQGKAPLWFYFNKESELVTGGRKLGPLGGRIVGEVVAGLLDSDQDSFVNNTFVPEPPIAPARGQFKFADLLRFAGAL